jgi:hypothetical protein
LAVGTPEESPVAAASAIDWPAETVPVFASTWENVRPTVVTATEVSRAKR